MSPDEMGPLTRKVLDYERVMRGLVPTVAEPADWEPLAEFVAVDDFERVGTFLEVQDWQEYTEMLTKWASATLRFETTLRRITANFPFMTDEEKTALILLPGFSTAEKVTDVSGRGVQINLLKLMEETEVRLIGQTDMLGQMQAMMDMQRGRGPAKRTLNTRHILFIVSGAFDTLADIIRRRVGSSAIGFGSRKAGEGAADWLRLVQTPDFVRDYRALGGTVS